MSGSLNSLSVASDPGSSFRLLLELLLNPFATALGVVCRLPNSCSNGTATQTLGGETKPLEHVPGPTADLRPVLMSAHFGAKKETSFLHLAMPAGRNEVGQVAAELGVDWTGESYPPSGVALEASLLHGKKVWRR